MRSSNPAFSSKVFHAYDVAGADVMTVQGTGIKTMMLLALATISGGFVWVRTVQAGAVQADVMPWMLGGLIVGLILSIATCFKPVWAPVTAPGYALAEGLFLGGISAMFNQMLDGVAFQAMGLTFGTLFSMLALYQSGVIKVTERLRTGVMSAALAIMLIYLVTIVMRMFGAEIPFIHGSGPIGIGFSLLVVGVAAFFLLLDFDFIERAVAQGSPKWMEWYGAFALMTTLVWLYLEFLRLLSKLRD